MRKKINGAVIAICCLLPHLAACGGTELENKHFPLAVVVGQKGTHCQVNYLSQNLSEVANERADGSNITACGAAAETYYETQKTFEKNNRCQLDLSHTKAVIFQKGFLEKGSLPLFLETVRREQTYAQNTLVYLSDTSMDVLTELNGTLEIPLGSYLEQMTENEQEIGAQAVVTLGALLKEQANSSRTLLLPVLKEVNDLPVIHAYEILQNFTHKGRISTDQAQIYYLAANQLEQMNLSMTKEVQVRLSNLKCRREFGLENGMAVQHLYVSADAEPVTGTVDASTLETELSNRILEVCRLLKEEQQADITDSYRHLALRAPELYRIYENQSEAYQKNLEYRVQVNIRLL